LWGGGKLRVMAVRSGQRLIGLAPFFLWGFGNEPEVLCLSFLGSGITDYLDLLAAPGFEADTAAAVVCQLLASDEWHVCDLQELRADAALLAAPIPPEFAWLATPCSVCPAADLAQTIEEHLAGLDAKFRTDLRRAERRLGKQGALAYESGIALLDRLFDLHGERWQERKETGVLQAGQLQAFHREAAARLLERGILRLYGLLIDGECVAAQYNFVAKGRAYAYLSGFNPAWSGFSPGAVLLKHSIGQAIAEGVATFDFLRKPEAFKYSWGAKDHVNQALVISREGE
jgi:CelD/BcsL family acetyltransferase involved in cellulose biosynthesis